MAAGHVGSGKRLRGRRWLRQPRAGPAGVVQRERPEPLLRQRVSAAAARGADERDGAASAIAASCASAATACAAAPHAAYAAAAVAPGGATLAATAAACPAAPGAAHASAALPAAAATVAAAAAARRACVTTCADWACGQLLDSLPIRLPEPAAVRHGRWHLAAGHVGPVERLRGRGRLR